MSDNLFNYTFNINTESAQNEVLTALDKVRYIPPVPESFFFADLDNFPHQIEEDGFGPVVGHETTKFRITSQFNITTQRAAYATTDGHLFFAPHGDDPDKVNIFLRPSKPVDIGVKIKFFVYRGILKSNIFTNAGGTNNLKLINHDPTTNLDFVNRLWNEYKEYNNLTNSTDPIEFNASELGYNASNPNDLKIIKTFFKSANGNSSESYNLARVSMGDSLGFFGPTKLGFEIVVDFGDYEQETSETGFDLDFKYACAKECILNLSGTNTPFVVGDIPVVPNVYAGISTKIFRENIYHFIDPAAYYGAHITQFGMKHGKVNTNIHIPGTGSVNENYAFYQDDIYYYIVSKFFTSNKIYLYILGKRGRSYNFYNETPFMPPSGPIQPAPDLTSTVTSYPPAEDFASNGWPIKILDDVNNPSYFTYSINSANNSFTRINFFLNYLMPTTDPFFNNCFYIRNTFNVERFKEFTVGEDANHTRTILKSPFYKPNSGVGLPIANFMYAIYSRNIDYSKYYNDLIGPIDVSGIYEPEDFETAEGNKVQWLIYNKPKMYHIANSNILGEMKVVFEGSGTDTAPSTDTRTRLYLIYPTDSDDPNFIKRYPFVSGCDIIDDKNTFAKSVYENKLNQNNSDIRIWRGSILDDGVSVDVLAVRNLIYDSDNVSNFIQIGLTQIEFNTINSGAPDNLKFNTFFHLDEVAVVSNDDYKKYQLGITYDNSNGDQVTYINTTNPVFLYSIDGKFFTTSNYVAQFAHSETFANIAVEFLPFTITDPILNPNNEEWYLKYGFDWMRKLNENYNGQNFPPFRNILGTIPTQTDSNDPTTGTFVPDYIMYNNLKVGEYNAIPLDWRIDNSDNDIEYFSSWLSLVKDNNKIYTVRLRIKTGNILPQTLRINYNTSLLKLSCPLDPNNSSHQNNANSNVGPNKTVFLNIDVNQLVTNSYNETTLNITLKETNSGAIPFKKELTVVSRKINDPTERIAGILNLFTDDKEREKKEEKLLFVPVSLQLPSGVASYNQTQLSNQIHFLRNYLRQALIDIDVEWYPTTLNIGNLPASYYDTINGIINIIGVNATVPNSIPLNKYLKQILGSKGRRVVFFINNIGGNFNNNGIFNQLGGFATGIGSDVVMFQIAQNDETTLAHEVLHSLGIPHTFSKLSKNSLYVYQGLQTDNIMDYTPVTRSTYHWQWLIARKNVKKLK
ncbi:hypothetical protein SY27_05185 [Flavobacterium sp. 316]|uniref:hypothetical protein n=1 Tax=Flavobacterium sp. 316 TaxID=1603293 RepID=UPI0005E311B1|nr:hypothetical protein [Flavobacterium sp. 316]KIX22064.1 hypothetical protein SY27_05185 [Flavobacterium sp. 316]